MTTIDVLATTERYRWIDHTEDMLLRYDSIMFPDEQHLLYSDAKITNHITYQDEREAYLFNSEGYFNVLKDGLAKEKVTPDMAFYEVERRAVILSAYAVRLRAWEIYDPPLRSLHELMRDDRVPWKWRKLIFEDSKLRALELRSRGALRKTRDGLNSAQSVDLSIVATLANQAYRSGQPTVWLRPFVLT